LRAGIKRDVGSIRSLFAATCAETADQLSDYLERELPSPRRRHVARHLRRCLRCRSLLDSLAWTVEQLRALGANDAPAESVADTVAERIRAEPAGRP
jgi:predicted anti-sigma-YlaC factor YlaD